MNGEYLQATKRRNSFFKNVYSNKRGDDRHQVNLSAQSEDGQTLEILDISHGGLRAKAASLIWPGNQTTLTLSHGYKVVAVRVEVLSFVAVPGGVAMRMRFIEASPALLAFIDRL